VQGHLMLARIYKQADQYTGMRREAQRALEVAPEAQRDGVRSLIERVLGATALEADPFAGETGDDEGGEDEGGVDEGLDEGEEGGEAGGDLQLGSGSRLLGGAPSGGGPGLLGGEEGGGGGGPLLRGGDPSTLRLGEPGGGGGPRLNLNE
jgi:hypothetical protein